MIKSYLNFVFRELPTYPTPNGFDVNEYFYWKVTGWTFFFIGWYYLFYFGGKWLFPVWYQKLPDRKRREYPVYAMCLVHHFVVVPRAWIHILQDFYRTPAELPLIHYVHLEAPMVPFSFGYLLGDTFIYALPELFRIGTYDYLLHHLLGSWLLISAMSISGHMMRYTPHLIICDTTNILFNIAWLLRTSEQYRDSTLVMGLEIGFALLFLPTRIINLTLMLVSAIQQEPAMELGLARFTLLPIILLQFFWFYKIIMGISSRLSPTERSTSRKEVNEDHRIDNSQNSNHTKKLQ